VAKLVRDVRTKELFAVKFIERGMKVTFLWLPLPSLNRGSPPLSRREKRFGHGVGPDRLMRILAGGFRSDHSNFGTPLS
jgi:hypothetical protein